ncbi:MAG: LarC family nickel insertion protein [Deltaproteobacteria bacterium]|nr:LarC family nickel insertion protein [Deltaproteobacteria bacterium]
MSRILFLESVAGVAGDMFAASFVDAGLVSVAELLDLPRQLALEGVQIDITRPTKATMRTTHINVGWKNESWKKPLAAFDHTHGGRQAAGHSHANITHPSAAEHWHTHYSELDRFLGASALDDVTKTFARKVFRLIAEAEAEAHGVTIEDVAFHEVGAVDSIVDVVMAAFCVAKVGASKVYATPVKIGRGLIKIEHGTQPVPPPASARLMVGMSVARVPEAITRENVELSTPTGLAIIKALTPEFVNSAPAGVVQAQGMGAGTMDLGTFPNVFRVTVLDDSGAAARAALPFETDEVVEICCNVDDETSERTAWTVEQLLELGALDAWVTPAVGKKGRVAMCLSVLAEPARWQELADWLLRSSSTFGLRHRRWDRLKLARRFETRDTAQGPVRYKVGLTTDGKVLKEKAEFEDLRAIWKKGPAVK